MEESNKHLNELREIRNLMEKSSRFLSLSGLSGVFAGIVALIGAGIAYWYFGFSFDYREYSDSIVYDRSGVRSEFYFFLFGLASAILLVALAGGWYFTQRKAKAMGLPKWDKMAERTLVELMIPLVAGGLFSIILLKHGGVYLVPGATLVFYGLALINASKFTLKDIRYLGLIEVALGITACYFANYGLLFWALGFGVLHVIYGIMMYQKYEK